MRILKRLSEFVVHEPPSNILQANVNQNQCVLIYFSPHHCGGVVVNTVASQQEHPGSTSWVLGGTLCVECGVFHVLPCLSTKCTDEDVNLVSGSCSAAAHGSLEEEHCTQCICDQLILFYSNKQLVF